MTVMSDINAKTGDGPRLDEPASGRSIGIRLIAPVAIALTVCALVIAAILWTGAREQDALSLSADRHLARTALAQTQRSLAGPVKDWAWWDEARNALFPTVDRDWAARLLANDAVETFGVSSSFVLSSLGEIVVAV